MLHKHRILPGHMGGSYVHENIELLSIPEHAEAHHQLFLKHGHIADYVAWKMLSGQMGKEEAFLAIQRSPECRARKSRSMKGNRNGVGGKSGTGKTLPPEHKAKIAVSLIGNLRCVGYKHSDETKAKHSVVMKGNSYARALLGKPKTIEHRAKISAAMQGKKNRLGRRKTTPTL